MVLDIKSGDYQSQPHSSSEQNEYLYKISWQFIQLKSQYLGDIYVCTKVFSKKPINIAITDSMQLTWLQTKYRVFNSAVFTVEIWITLDVFTKNKCFNVLFLFSPSLQEVVSQHY